MSLKDKASSLDPDFFKSLTSDFENRDLGVEQLTSTILKNPFSSKRGVLPIHFLKPFIPDRYDAITWARNRIEIVARKYIGLPYKHSHVPLLGGLDCSTFASWVYNYGLGIHINLNLGEQSKKAGRPLGHSETFQKGDLLYLWDHQKARIYHVMIFIGEGQVIDSSLSSGVQIRDWEGWRMINFAYARRLIEEDHLVP